LNILQHQKRIFIAEKSVRERLNSEEQCSYIGEKLAGRSWDEKRRRLFRESAQRSCFLDKWKFS